MEDKKIMLKTLKKRLTRLEYTYTMQYLISTEDECMSVHSYMVKTATGSAYAGTDRTRALDVYCQAVVHSPRAEYIELDRDGKMIKLDHGREAL